TTACPDDGGVKLRPSPGPRDKPRVQVSSCQRREPRAVLLLSVAIHARPACGGNVHHPGQGRASVRTVATGDVVLPCAAVPPLIRASSHSLNEEESPVGRPLSD